MLRATLGLAALVGTEVEALLRDGATRTPALPAVGEQTGADEAGDERPGTDWVHLAWGAAAAGGDRAARAAARLRAPIGVAADLGTWVLEAPPLAPATRRVRTTVHELVERGRIEDRTSRDAASALADRVLWTVVRSEVLDRVVVDVLHRAIGPALDDLSNRPEDLLALVQAIVADVIGPVLDQALPIALQKLGDQPELLGPVLDGALPVALEALGSKPELLAPVLDGALPLALTEIAKQPELLVPVLDAVVNEALEPMLREVLPLVFQVLADDPEAVRSLVRDQSTGVAADMAGSLRIQAARADDRVDKAVRRVLRRRPIPAPEVPPALPPAGP